MVGIRHFKCDGRALLLAGVAGLGAADCTGKARTAAPDPGVFVEGTRLKAVYQQVEGAPPLFLNWFDTQLGVDCGFTDVGLTAGRLVCLPRVSYASGPLSFTDSGCTQPLVALDNGSCANEAPFIAEQPSIDTPCGSTFHLFPLGPALTADPAAVFSMAGSSCQPTSGGLQPNFSVFHPIGPEIPLDQLVGGTYRHDSGPGRIVPLSIVGSDGSIQVAGSVEGVGGPWDLSQTPAGWDNERDEAVSASPGGYSLDRWGPAAEALGFFGDSACSSSVTLGSACDAPPKEISLLGTDPCGDSVLTGALHVGAQLPDGAPIYEGVSNACNVFTIPPNTAAFALGAQIPAGDYAEVTEVRTGSRQVQLVRTGTTDGPPIYATGFFDAVHGWECSPGTAADLVTRCLPYPSWIGPFFADAACSVSIAFDMIYVTPSPRPSTCPAWGPTVVSRRDPSQSNATCNPVYGTHFYPIGHRYTGPLFYSDRDMTGPGAPCTAIGSTDSIDPTAYNNASGNDPALAPRPIPTSFNVVGPEIPANDFAPVTTVRPQ